jgi:hypothetical protein
MSLARAFTKRIAKREEDSFGRSKTVRYAAGSIRRDMISLPTELISTTNVQALNAPDISSLSKSRDFSSTSSVSSNNDSDFSTFDKSFLSDHDRTDASSIEASSPATPVTPPMDHADDFFGTKTSSGPVKILSSDPVPDAPAVPQRAPSHSKKAHVELSRKRSVQRMSPPPSTIPEQPRTSAEFFGAGTAAHPFGKELAKVNEVAEEFGAGPSLMDEEEQEILSKGCQKFTVEDYILEIADLYGGVFDGRLGPVGNPWI